jgi:uncharacterized protein YqkB
MKNELTQLANGIISEIGLLNRVQTESRESILNYLGLFGSEIDELINKFYDINTKIADNGGAPVLKQLINKLYENDTLTIEIAESTACLMLKDDNGNLIHNEFINKYNFIDNLVEKGNEYINSIVKEYARKHNLNNFVWGGLV